MHFIFLAQASGFGTKMILRGFFLFLKDQMSSKHRTSLQVGVVFADFTMSETERTEKNKVSEKFGNL